MLCVNKNYYITPTIIETKDLYSHSMKVPLVAWANGMKSSPDNETGKNYLI